MYITLIKPIATEAYEERQKEKYARLKMKNSWKISTNKKVEMLYKKQRNT